MYKRPHYHTTDLSRKEIIEGETIEMKIERIVNNKETIKDGAPTIFTERKDGVISAYNIRTDRWEIATDAMTLVEKSITAKRENKGKVVNLKKDGEPEPIQGTKGGKQEPKGE
jgi:hypothetical protein